MKYDNVRDRFKYGFDAGVVVDGVVAVDNNTGEHIIIDDSGVAFSPNEHMKSLNGRVVKVTIVCIDSLDVMDNMT